MRVIALLSVTACFLLVAGCGPKPLPEWAMYPGAKIANAPRETAYHSRYRERHVPAAPRAIVAPPVAANTTEVKPFSPEWSAREDAINERLRRQMRICATC